MNTNNLPIVTPSTALLPIAIRKVIPRFNKNGTAKQIIPDTKRLKNKTVRCTGKL